MNHPNSQAISDNGGYELISGELVGLDGLRIACSNCKERGLRCVYVNLKSTRARPGA
jgi:hypothetical protein